MFFVAGYLRDADVQVRLPSRHRGATEHLWTHVLPGRVADPVQFLSLNTDRILLELILLGRILICFFRTRSESSLLWSLN